MKTEPVAGPARRAGILVDCRWVVCGFGCRCGCDCSALRNLQCWHASSLVDGEADKVVGERTFVKFATYATNKDRMHIVCNA